MTIDIGTLQERIAPLFPGVTGVELLEASH
jgi:hypothetical protein